MSNGYTNIQIDNCEKTKEQTPDGKKYTIHEWKCSGYIDGDWAEGFTVKTFSGKEADYVQEGWEGWCELDEFKGRVSYVIPKPEEGDRGQGAAQGLRKVASSKQQRKAPPPRKGNGPVPSAPRQGGMTSDELDSLFTHAYILAHRLCGDDPDTISRLISTYVIAARDDGIRVSPSDAGEDEPPASSMNDKMAGVLTDEIKKVLEDMNLMERVSGSDITDEELIEWWNETEGSEFAFGSKVNAELKNR